METAAGVAGKAMMTCMYPCLCLPPGIYSTCIRNHLFAHTLIDDTLKQEEDRIVKKNRD
jgi:hypothetical protein